MLQVQVVDQLMQSGYCAVAVSQGEARLRKLRVTDLATEFGAGNGLAARSVQENNLTGFTSTPRRNLIYHVWPVRGSMWRWNLEQLKASAPALPVIVVSGHGTIETAVRAIKLGAADFIEKPFSLDTLLRSVYRALGRKPTDSASRGEPSGMLRGVPVAQRLSYQTRARTIKQSVVVQGQGLHSGVRTGVILQPLPPGRSKRKSAVNGRPLRHVSTELTVRSWGKAYAPLPTNRCGIARVLRP